jgi:DNA-binding NtrC family response regulator
MSNSAPPGEEHAKTRAIIRQVAIVDDERDIRQAYANVLARLGAKIALQAEDPHTLIEAMKTQNADLILIDYHFPGKEMNGLKTAELVRQIKPNAKIVIISGDDTIRNQVVQAGFKFILKPISVSNLADILAPTEGGARGEMARN